MEDLWRNPRLKHAFDLSGMSAGDHFIGCNSCWWKLAPEEWVGDLCQKCSGALSIFRVVPDDLLTADSETVGGVQ